MGGCGQAVGTESGCVQLFAAAEFQRQQRQPPLSPQLSLQPFHSEGDHPVQFLQWRNDGDILIAVSEDCGQWQVAGWHMLQSSVGDWSALPAAENLLNHLISPMVLAELDAARSSPYGAASLPASQLQGYRQQRAEPQLWNRLVPDPADSVQKADRASSASSPSMRTTRETHNSTRSLHSDEWKHSTAGSFISASPPVRSASSRPAVDASLPQSAARRSFGEEPQRHRTKEGWAGGTDTGAGAGSRFNQQTGKPQAVPIVGEPPWMGFGAPFSQRTRQAGSSRMRRQRGSGATSGMPPASRRSTGSEHPLSAGSPALAGMPTFYEQGAVYQPAYYVPFHSAESGFPYQQGRAGLTRFMFTSVGHLSLLGFAYL